MTILSYSNISNINSLMVKENSGGRQFHLKRRPVIGRSSRLQWHCFVIYSAYLCVLPHVASFSIRSPALRACASLPSVTVGAY